MSTEAQSEWRVLTLNNGDIVYHNDITGEETKEAPYVRQLNKYKNCDVGIWSSRRDECIRFASVHPRPRINLDINYGERIGGRITVELYADIAPLAAYNFYCLCTNECAPIGGYELKLKGTYFYKCVPGVGMYGGDITNGDGTGGMTVYGAPFEEENTNRPLDRAGLLICEREGLNINPGRFIITADATPQFFGKYSLFGRVVRGIAVVRNTMNMAITPEGKTKEVIAIANTTVIEDGPTPPEFTIPLRPSLRPTPLVPPACSALTTPSMVVGQSHMYTTMKEEDMKKNEEVPTPEEGPQSESESEEDENDEAEPQAPGDDAANLPIATSENPDPYAYAYANYAYANMNAYNANQEEPEAPPGEAPEAKSSDYTATATFSSNTGGFISAGMDDSRRGNMPRDGDGRVLAHYLDLSQLDVHTAAKKKSHKIPNGFKSWKEYGEFKKKEKRARQVRNILEDKYPLEELEKRRRH